MLSPAVPCPCRKLDEEYKERIAALKNELRREREQILQQANKQRLELEQEIEKLKTDENYIRDRLALALKVMGTKHSWDFPQKQGCSGRGSDSCSVVLVERMSSELCLAGQNQLNLSSKVEVCP